MHTTDSTPRPTLMDRYLETWLEADAQRRRELIAATWSPSGTLSVSSLGTTLEGIGAITEHITRVHDDMIATKGLRFTYDQEVTSGEATLLRWSVSTPADEVVGRGVDLVFLDESGAISRAYMFMGVQ